MQLSYRLGRGFHYWVCVACGEGGKEVIPDQADDRYHNNPGNPLLAVCPNCNHGKGTGDIQLGPSAIPAQKALDDEGKAELPDGEWGLYWELSGYFVKKVRFQDKDDFRHDLILEIYKVATKYKATGKQLTRAGINRIAAYEVANYWHREKLASQGIKVNCSHCQKAQKDKCRKDFLYSQCPKAKRFISLNEQGKVEDDGTVIELWQVLADDKAMDFDAWTSNNPWLLGYPQRLVEIALKIEAGIPLNAKDQE